MRARRAPGQMLGSGSETVAPLLAQVGDRRVEVVDFEADREEAFAALLELLVEAAGLLDAAARVRGTTRRSAGARL